MIDATSNGYCTRIVIPEALAGCILELSSMTRQAAPASTRTWLGCDGEGELATCFVARIYLKVLETSSKHLETSSDLDGSMDHDGSSLPMFIQCLPNIRGTSWNPRVKPALARITLATVTRRSWAGDILHLWPDEQVSMGSTPVTELTLISHT